MALKEFKNMLTVIDCLNLSSHIDASVAFLHAVVEAESNYAGNHEPHAIVVHHRIDHVLNKFPHFVLHLLCYHLTSAGIQ